MAKNILTISKLHDDRYSRIVEGLAWLVRYSKNDIKLKTNNVYTIRVLDLSDDVKISCSSLTPNRRISFDGFRKSETTVLVTRNDDTVVGIPVVVGTDCMSAVKNEALGKILNEFDLFYDEECEDEIDVVEYKEVVEEVLDEIYGLASLHKLEIYS